MAKTITTPFKTPKLPLGWVNISGQGKLQMRKPDDGDPKNYRYVATVFYPDEAAMKKDKAVFDKFWKDNKPVGATKQNYSMFKPEMTPVLDSNGKPQEDDEGAIIKEPTGRWALTAKTITHWPKDGKQNVIKVLRGNGNPLNLGDRKIGNGSVGVVHGAIGINDTEGNQGLMFFLNAVQLTKFVEYTGSDAIDAEDLGEDEGMDDLDLDAAEAPSDNLPQVK